ncbi:MAG: orotate phosphoribosyltransferase [Thermodesulfobacteriota bacterium]|nr:orotate phosphoribosyltransferase [Thermodesulfobacteriota bacterium]
MTEKQRLIELVRERAFRQTETPEFTLASGKKSCFYFNLKTVTCSSEGLYLVGKIIYNQIEEMCLDPDGVGGLTMGADPISYAVGYTFHLNNRTIEAFSIRKEPKDHGTGLQIEGNVDHIRNVIITEDVVTTGGSTIKAIHIARENGLNVIGVITLLDRCEENGRQNIEAEGVSFNAILTIDDFR